MVKVVDGCASYVVIKISNAPIFSVVRKIKKIISILIIVFALRGISHGYCVPIYYLPIWIINDILVDSDQTFFGTNDGLFVYDKKSKLWNTLTPSNCDDLPYREIESLFVLEKYIVVITPEKMINNYELMQKHNGLRIEGFQPKLTYSYFWRGMLLNRESKETIPLYNRGAEYCYFDSQQQKMIQIIFDKTKGILSKEYLVNVLYSVKISTNIISFICEQPYDDEGITVVPGVPIIVKDNNLLFMKFTGEKGEYEKERILQIDIQRKNYSFIKIEHKQDHFTITSLAKDNDILWIGTRIGIYKYDLNTKETDHFNIKEAIVVSTSSWIFSGEPMTIPINKTFRKLKRINKNEVVQILGRRNDWYKVKLEEPFYGWIYYNPTPLSGFQSEKNFLIWYAGSPVFVKENSDENSLDLLSADSLFGGFPRYIPIIEKKDKWYKLEISEGWVNQIDILPVVQ